MMTVRAAERQLARAKIDEAKSRASKARKAWDACREKESKIRKRVNGGWDGGDALSVAEEGTSKAASDLMVAKAAVINAQEFLKGLQ